MSPPVGVPCSIGYRRCYRSGRIRYESGKKTEEYIGRERIRLQIPGSTLSPADSDYFLIRAVVDVPKKFDD